jgi:hypothetical protein
MHTAHRSDAPDLVTRLADLAAIVREPDPVLRNLRITQRYHDLSHALRARVHAGGPAHANWSTFATWASKTAGRSIRGEDVPDELARALAVHTRLEDRMAALVDGLPGLGFVRLDATLPDLANAIVAEISAQIAEGNLRVFAELAPLFARFAALPDDDAEFAGFLAALAPGPAADGGQDALRAAFTSYFVAARSADAKLRAELTLHANLLIGLHEQTRLQPNIEAGLDAPVSPRVHAALHDTLPAPVRPLLRRLLGDVREGWERTATRFFMRLALPRGRELSLGEDIPARCRAFPASLDPLDHAECAALVRSYDPDVDSTRGSAAVNWTRLADRMGFITDLFRSHQEQDELFGQPFADSQRAELEAGRVPRGPL